MTASGVPDLLSFSRLSRAVTNVKSQAETSRIEAVTGRYEDVTKAVDGDIGGVHLIKKALDDAQAYQQTLSLAENRTLRTQTVLGNLTTESTRIGASALSAISAEGVTASKTAAADARATLYSVFAALNTTAGGRALFSGDAVETPPLGSVEDLLSDVKTIIAAGPDAASVETALDAYFNDPAGGFETTIYKGGANEAPAVEVAPGLRLNSAVKANAEPIKDLIRGFAVLANYETLPGGSDAERDIVFESGAKQTLSAETKITDLRAIIGIAEGRIAGRKEQYASEETVLTNLYNSKTARDPYEAAAQLKLLESQLEASYLLTARLGNLSLANYLG